MTQVTLEQALQLGLAHHQAGRLAEAESVYRAILGVRPQHPDALDLLGVLAEQLGRDDEAISLIEQAIAASPGNPVYHFHLGGVLHGRRQFQAAIAAYQRAVASKPDFVEALLVEGNAWKEIGRLDEAIACYEKALGFQADYPEALNNLGNAWMGKKQFDRAMESFRRAIAIQPQYAEAHNNLGFALRAVGRLDESIESFQRATDFRPELIDAHMNLGNAWKDMGQTNRAVASFQRALAINPGLVQAHINLGNAWGDAGNLDEAIACNRRALSIKSDLPEAHNNLGALLAKQLGYDEAIAHYRAAIATKPDSAAAHFNLAHALLATGHFAEGWDEFEFRRACLATWTDRILPQPVWNGENIPGQTILLTAEQGLGDTIQFARYAPLVAARCERMWLECPAEMVVLFRGLGGVARVFAQGDSLPEFDAHCPLMSLPRIFRTTGDSIPANIPYIAADPERVRAWAAKFTSVGRKKIGLSWAGRAANLNDRNRSCWLSTFAPLADISSAVFYSLQVGSGSEQVARPPPGMELIDLTREVRDFADTAALIANLDLVISVDTAIVHLAGAMGREVWTLLPFCPDWRWQLDRSDSPWYPTMRLFRQPAAGDWGRVMAHALDALRQWMLQPPSAS